MEVRPAHPFQEWPNPEWCAPQPRLAIPASLRSGVDKPFNTVVKSLSISSFTAQAINRLNPGSRCWLTLPGLAAKQAEVLTWQGAQVTCRFTENLSPIILDSVVQRTRPPANH